MTNNFVCILIRCAPRLFLFWMKKSRKVLKCKLFAIVLQKIYMRLIRFWYVPFSSLETGESSTFLKEERVGIEQGNSNRRSGATPPPYIQGDQLV